MLGWGCGRAPRRRRLVAVSAAVAAVALVGPGCTRVVAGQGTLDPPPAVTASGATYLALLDLSGSGAVHYRGVVSVPGLDGVDVDLEVTSGGAATGTVDYHGKPATMLAVNRTTYLRAAQDYWTTLGQNKDLARRYANRWVKAPPTAFGVDLGTVLAPATLARQLQRGLDQGRGTPFADLPTASVQGVPAVKVATAEASYFVSAAQPYRLLRLETPSRPRFVPPIPGPNDLADIGLDITDRTTGQVGVYQRVRQLAGQLGQAVDGQVRLVQGAQGFVGCGPASCTLRVTFTNAAPVPVRTQLHADWTGDGAPLGGCDRTAGRLGARRIGSATCTITSPAWVAFYFRASSTPGTHPYVALWTVVALADPPELSQLDRQATAARCAAAGLTGGAVPANCPPVPPQGAPPNRAEPPGSATAGTDLAAGHDAAVRLGYDQLARRFPHEHGYGDVPGYRYAQGAAGSPTGSRGSTGGAVPAEPGFPDLLVYLGGRVYMYQVKVGRTAGYTPATRGEVQRHVQRLRAEIFPPEIPVRYGPAIDPVTVHDPQIDRDVRIFSRPGYPGVIFYAVL